MANATLDELLARYSPEVQALARGTRSLVLSVFPNAQEKVHLGWKNVTFATGSAMEQMVFALCPQTTRVNLNLVGVGLEDPAGLLEGTGQRIRHVKITSPAMLKDPALAALLRQAVAPRAAPAGDGRPAAEAAPGTRKIDRVKTIAAPVAAAYAAWTDARRRRRWLPDAAFTVRKATDGKSLRLTWGDGTWVTVAFTAKGADRSVVAVEHSRLADAATAEQWKRYWGERLETLRAQLEG